MLLPRSQGQECLCAYRIWTFSSGIADALEHSSRLASSSVSLSVLAGVTRSSVCSFDNGPHGPRPARSLHRHPASGSIKDDKIYSAHRVQSTYRTPALPLSFNFGSRSRPDTLRRAWTPEINRHLMQSLAVFALLFAGRSATRAVLVVSCT